MRTLPLPALVIASLAALAPASPARAQEETIELAPGPGKETVEQSCAACHSLDYIVINAPFLDRAKWDATIKKMRGAFGAPIEDADAAAILDYLAAHYGPG